MFDSHGHVEAWWKDWTHTAIMLKRPESLAFITPQGLTAKEMEINAGAGTFRHGGDHVWVTRGHEEYVRAKVEMWRSLRHPIFPSPLAAQA